MGRDEPEEPSLQTESRSGGIRKWPKSERPRERLLERGAEALSTAELLAILFGHGERGRTALDLARSVLASGERTVRLSRLTPAVLRTVRGVGPAKAARVAAALELGRRMLAEKANGEPRLTASAAVAQYVRARLAALPKEVFLCIAVDVKNRPISVHEAARGSGEEVVVSPRELLGEALRVNASGIICVHNHPSGDPAPSAEDRVLTGRLRDAARLLGLRFLDHVIVTADAHFSFCDQGL